MSKFTLFVEHEIDQICSNLVANSLDGTIKDVDLERVIEWVSDARLRCYIVDQVIAHHIGIVVEDDQIKFKRMDQIGPVDLSDEDLQKLFGVD